MDGREREGPKLLFNQGGAPQRLATPMSHFSNIDVARIQ